MANSINNFSAFVLPPHCHERSTAQLDVVHPPTLDFTQDDQKFVFLNGVPFKTLTLEYDGYEVIYKCDDAERYPHDIWSIKVGKITKFEVTPATICKKRNKGGGRDEFPFATCVFCETPGTTNEPCSNKRCVSFHGKEELGHCSYCGFSGFKGYECEDPVCQEWNYKYYGGSEDYSVR
jgi:hypothetical protein